MKLATWNINGLRSGEEKFMAFMGQYRPDIIALQEVKAHPDQLPFTLKLLPGYSAEYHWCEFNYGYSGTAFFIKDHLKSDLVTIGLQEDEFDREGRSISTQIGKTTLINCYFPLGMGEGKDLFKLRFCKKVYDFVKAEKVRGQKVILLGDVNIATDERDVPFPEKMKNHPVYAQPFRDWLSQLKKLGMVDSFRKFSEERSYSWFPYTDPGRVVGSGMRIDYIFVDSALENSLQSAEILKSVYGSDHCPLIVETKNI